MIDHVTSQAMVRDSVWVQCLPQSLTVVTSTHAPSPSPLAAGLVDRQVALEYATTVEEAAEVEATARTEARSLSLEAASP